MTRKIHRNRAGDAANSFVRVLLTEASIVAGGFTDENWKQTLEWFDGRCAYTDQLLSEDDTVKDHAIPINRLHCGLDLYGNVVPTTKETNQRKGSRHYEAFLKGEPERRKRLECFIECSGYRRKAEMFGDLSGYCEAQYEMITKLCEVNRGYLQSLSGCEADLPEKYAPLASTADNDVLPIEFDPAEPNGAFKKALLSRKSASITTFFADGTKETRFWNASRVKPESDIVNNIRSRPEYRSGEWQRRRITRARVRVDRSGV